MQASQQIQFCEVEINPIPAKCKTLVNQISLAVITWTKFCTIFSWNNTMMTNQTQIKSRRTVQDDLIFRGGWFSRSYNFCWKQFHYLCNSIISYNMMFKGSSEEVERWIWMEAAGKRQMTVETQFFRRRSEESEVGRMGMFANVQTPLPMCNVQCEMCNVQCANLITNVQCANPI